MNKNCTSLEQSKKLAEILPIESADMYYEKRCNLPKVIVGNYSLHMQCRATDKDYKKLTYPVLSPCWSLAALLNAYPMVVGRDLDMFCCWQNHKNLHSKHYDNPIDACYEMIVKLYEQKLL